MDNIYELCELFYASHYIPVCCITHGKAEWTIGFPESLPEQNLSLDMITGSPHYPFVYSPEDSGLYGVLKIDDRFLHIGPVYATGITQDTVRLYMKKNIIAHRYAEEVYNFLVTIPQTGYYQFFNLIIFLHYLLTGEKIEQTERFADDPGNKIGHIHQEIVLQNREEPRIHGTWLFEQQLLEYIRSGNPEGLHLFLAQAVKERPLTEGIIGDTPLRQAKNIMQGQISLVGKTAAIPGGMDVELAYQLMDSYGMECERQRSVEAVAMLQFNMLLDFARQVEQSRHPADLSPEIYACIQYVNFHINEPIGINDIAEYTARSRSTLTTHFRKEMGCSIAEYITQVRIREAKSLLRFTDRTIGEISEYLAFSNQSHFQRVFKQAMDMTPAEYRRKKKS